MTTLFYARDPAAVNWMIAARERLEAGDPPRGLEHARPPFRSLAKSYAIARWPGAEAWNGMPDLGDVSLLVTGTTDVDDRTDWALWAAARAAGVPSACLLDRGTDVEHRFPPDPAAWPDRVLVPDEAAAALCRAFGIPAGALHVCGDLHLERLKRRGVDGARAAALRARWAGPGPVVLFASECLAEMRAAGKPIPVDEFDVLAALIARSTGTVVIRPHPRDTPGKYDAWRREAGPRVLVSEEGSPAEAILAADVVAGITSTMLDEAAALGRPVERLP
ncbi:MAG: hypothetical protein OHK0024_32830 [Thalassobaculales bacterium]